MSALAFAFLCLVWGTTWLAIKLTLQAIPPFSGAALRFIVAAVILFLFSRFNGISLKISRSQFKMLLWSGLLLYVLDYGLIYWGEQYLSAGVTAIFFATFPLFTGIFATFVFRDELFHWNKFFGLALGFIGILVIFYDQLLQTDFETIVIFAVLAIILAAIGGALSTVMVKKYLTGIHAVSLSLHQMIWGAASLFLFGVVAGELPNIHFQTRSFLAVLYLGAVGSALAFVLYYWLLRRIGAISLSFVIYVTPVIAIIVDWLYFGQLVSLRTIGGLILIFLGITLSQINAYRAMLQRRHAAIPALI